MGVGDGPKVTVGVRLGSAVGVLVGMGVKVAVGVWLGCSACSVSVQAAAVISDDSVCTTGGLGCGSEHPAHRMMIMRTQIRNKGTDTPEKGKKQKGPAPDKKARSLICFNLFSDEGNAYGCVDDQFCGLDNCSGA